MNPILKYRQDHPDETAESIAAEIGMSVMSLNRHQNLSDAGLANLSLGTAIKIKKGLKIDLYEYLLKKY